MALAQKQKDKARRVIRVLMVFVAVLLLLLALAVPIANNAVALGIENHLKSLPLPADTELVESISAAGKLIGSGNGMQYFGAILLRSDLSLAELNAHYRTHREGLNDCLVEPQSGAEIRPRGESLNPSANLEFTTEMAADGYFLVYTWGSAPEWLRDWLDTDLRGH